MNIASHILYTLLIPVLSKTKYMAILSYKMCGNNNGIGGHQKINIYHTNTKTIYRKPRKQKNKK